MIRDQWPGEKGDIVRLKISHFVGPGAPRWATSLVLSVNLLTTAPLFAQDPPAGDPAAEATPEAEAPRRAAGIAWNPRTTPEEIKKLRQREVQDFLPAMKSPSLTTAQDESLKRHVQNAVNSLTVEQEIDNFSTIIERKIVQQIDSTATSPPARAVMLDTALKGAEELLVAQPPIVQFNAVLLASSLNSKAADLAARKPATPYGPASKMLIKVVQDTTFPVHVRNMAVRGLTRMLRDGESSATERGDWGTVLAAALDQPVEQPLAAKWYHLRLVEALGLTNRIYNVDNKPVIIDGLLKTLANPKEDWVVRAAAARAISQLPYDASVNVELINHEIGKLAFQLSEAFNADKNKAGSDWRWSMANLYLAYSSATAQDQNVRHWGLRFQQGSRGKPQIEAVYAILKPIFKSCLEKKVPEPIAKPQLDALKNWLSQNTPTDRKATPSSPDLKEVEPSAEKDPMTALPASGGTLSNKSS